jgi:hypothetical protein
MDHKTITSAPSLDAIYGEDVLRDLEAFRALAVLRLLKDLRLEHDAARPAVVRMVFARKDGGDFVLTMPIPLTLFCGDYVPGTRYDPLNMVSHGGLTWTASRATDAIPGHSDAWECNFEPMSADDVHENLKWWSSMVKEIAHAGLA